MNTCPNTATGSPLLDVLLAALILTVQFGSVYGVWNIWRHRRPGCPDCKSEVKT